MKGYLIEYLRHSALNFGQAMRDIRYFFNYPETKGIMNIVKRITSLGNNLYYTILPPRWHHTREELHGMKRATVKKWFLVGYQPWVHDWEWDESRDKSPE